MPTIDDWNADIAKEEEGGETNGDSRDYRGRGGRGGGRGRGGNGNYRGRGGENFDFVKNMLFEYRMSRKNDPDRFHSIKVNEFLLLPSSVLGNFYECLSFVSANFPKYFFCYRWSQNRSILTKFEENLRQCSRTFHN